MTKCSDYGSRFTGDVYTALDKVLEVVPTAYFRFSAMQTPHLVVPSKGAVYFYAKPKVYKLFWPWPCHDYPQRSRAFKNPYELRDFLI